MRNGGDGFEVGDIQAGIAHRFAEEEFGFRRDRLGEILRILRIDETHRDAELREDVVKLREGAAVEIVRRDDLVPCGAEIDDRVENRTRPGSQCQSGRAALHFRDALLEHIVGGVHQARVDVAEFAQAKEVRGMLGIAENKRAGAVDRHRAGEGDGIGGGAAVEAEGFEFHGRAFFVGEGQDKKTTPRRASIAKRHAPRVHQHPVKSRRSDSTINSTSASSSEPSLHEIVAVSRPL